MEKRDFLRLFKNFFSFSLLSWLAQSKAHAAWKKVGKTSGTAGTWQKIVNRNPRIAGMAMGNGYSLAFNSEGNVYGSGDPTDGRMGNNTGSTTYSTFVPALGVSNVVALASSFNHSLALKAGGTVFSTGRNDFGQLGNGTTTNRSTFAQVTGVSNIVAIAASFDASYALDASGNVWSCGNNSSGQLGNNSAAASAATFVQATGISNASAIGAARYFVASLRSDGYVYACGDNFYGNLGDNTTTSRSTFVQSIGVSNAVAIACSNTNMFAITAGGLVFGTGANTGGQLGTNNTAARSTFVQATGISNAIAISSAVLHCLALRSDGLVFGSGFSNMFMRSTFAQVLGVSNVIAISAGAADAFALRADGVLFAAGYNSSGNLATNDTSAYATFVQCTDISY